MRQQQGIDTAHRYSDLIEPDRRAAAGVYEQSLVADLDERAWPKPVRTRSGHSGPEQRHAEIA
jgi:hypothetical protein